MTKQEEYTLMQNSKPYDLKTVVGGKTIRWIKIWDHKAGINQIIFRTLTPPPYEHKLIDVQEIDLMPIANKKIFKITIKRK